MYYLAFVKLMVIDLETEFELLRYYTLIFIQLCNLYGRRLHNQRAFPSHVVR